MASSSSVMVVCSVWMVQIVAQKNAHQFRGGQALMRMAEKEGFEPSTARLTAGSTTAVLLLNLVPTRGIEPRVIRLQGGCIASNAWRAYLVGLSGLQPASLAYEARASTVNASGQYGCEVWIRTRDLRVMGPPRYRFSTSQNSRAH